MKCTTCGIELTNENIYPNNKSKCKTCINAAAKKWRKDNPDKVKKQMLRKKGDYHKSAQVIERRKMWKIHHFFNNLWDNIEVPKKSNTVCIKCGIMLNEDTWGNGRRNAKNYICKKCDYERVLKYQKNNPKYLNYIKEKSNQEPKRKMELKKKYKEDLEQNRIKYLEMWAKRKGRGFMPLNEYFEDADGHHIDNDHVIFMPMFIHRKIPHRHDDSEAMHLINLWAIFWLIYGIYDKEIPTKIPKWVFL